MRRIFIFTVLAMISFVVMGATLQNLTFSATQGSFQARLLFDSKPVWDLSGVLGNSPKITFDGTISSRLLKTIEWGPAKATLASTNSHGTVKFDFPFIVSTFVGEKKDVLTVSFVTLGISQSLALTGTATKISIDFSGEKGSTLGLAIKYLARLLKRNLVIDPQTAKKPVNITLSDVTPSEAFYDVLISSPGVGYAVLPDGTYYIAEADSLVKDLGKLGVGTYNNIVSFYDLSKTNASFTEFSSLVSNLFGSNRVIDHIGSYAIVKATAEQQKTIESLMSFLKESENFKTVEWPNFESEPELQKLISEMYPTVKMLYLKSFSSIIMSGNKTELEKASEVISKYSEILSRSGPKVSVTFNVPVQNVPAFLQFSRKFPAVTPYGSPSRNSSNAIYIVNGPEKQVSEFEKDVKFIASTLTMAKPRIIHFSFANWPDKGSVNDLLQIVKIMYPKVKYVYLPSFGQILFYGINTLDVNSASSFVKTRKPIGETGIQKTTVTVGVLPKNLKTVDAFLKSEFPTLFGTGTISPKSTELANYIVSGPSTEVSDFIASLKNSNLVVGTTVKTPSKTSSEENIYIREIPWSDEKSSSDIEKLVGVKYPRVKIMFLKNLGEFVVYGVDSSRIDEVVEFITSHLKSEKRAKNPPVTTVVKVSVNNYETVKSMTTSKGLTFYGPTNVSTGSTAILVGISGAASQVENIVALMKTTGLAEAPTPVATSTSPTATRVQAVVVYNKKISCDVENYPLSSLIQRVYRAFDRNVIFAAKSLPDVTIKLSNVELQQFEYALSNAYNLTFSGTSLVIVESNNVGITRIYRASDNVDKIKSMAEFVGAKVFTDPNTGMIVVNGLTPAKAGKLDAMVKPLINPRRDINIEAKIVDVSGNNNVSKNLKTTFMTPQLIFNDGLSLSFNLLDASNLPKFFSGMANKVISSNATVNANLSQTTGNASILSSPTLTTQSGESANILVGSKYPYVVTTIVNGQQQQQLKFLDTGIQLTILPLALPNGQISLTITIEVSDADWGHAMNGIPAVNTRTASMKVVVSNGQTIMIGGLTKHSRSQNVTKIPFFGDLPFVGQFFRSTSFQDSISNLDIFITAKVEG